MAVGILSGLPVLLARLRTEQANRNVELVASATDFESLALSQGVTPAKYLAALRRVGVKGLGVSEDTLGSLAADGRISYLSGADWLAEIHTVGAATPPFPLRPDSTYVLTSNEALAVWLSGSLGRLPGGAGVRTYRLGNRRVLEVPIPPNSLDGVPLGFAPGAFDLARSTGMDPVARPQGLPTHAMNAADVRGLFDAVAAAGVPVHTIVFAGASTTPIPGFPRSLPATVDAMRRGGYNLGVIETANQLTNVDQPGTRQLNDALGQRTVRVYSVPPWLLVDYPPPEAALSVVNSVVERNLRLVYLHPLLKGTDLLQANLDLWGSVARSLQAHGFRLAPPQPFAAIHVPAFQRALQGLAAVAAGLLWLDLLFDLTRRWRWGLLVVLGVLAAAAGAATHSTGILLGALGTAVAFGGLSSLVVAGLWMRLGAGPPRGGLAALWGRGVVTALAAFGVAVAGGLILASLMGSTSYILDWDYFRGVKAVYLGIPLLAAVGFVRVVGLQGSAPGRAPRAEGGSGSSTGWPRGAEGAPGAGWTFFRRELRWLGGQPVTYLHALVFLVLGAVGGYYLLRSGNVGVASVPGVEQHMRDLLMRLLTYRPREKEFLVGYPALLLAALCAARRWRWLFGVCVLGASVAQVSVVDTFEHSRTPLFNSLLREAFGLGVGLATATVAFLVVAAVAAALSRRAGGGSAPADRGGAAGGAVRP